jgi:serine/threonine protein kinase
VANDFVNDPAFKLRLQDEAHRYQRLQHPHIVSILDVFEADGETCIVMQLIEGMSLANFLENQVQHRLAINEAIPIMRDILTALNYAHQQGIVHCDVKPSNVLLDRDHQAMLIDFGIALDFGEERRTRTGQIIGTPAYMSPEQITKPKSLDHRSDVYNVGCVFYEMLTGRPPFIKGEAGVGETDFAIQQAHVTKRPVNLRSRIPSVSPDLDKLIMAALEKDPNKRIPGCQEFLRLLEQMGTPWHGEQVYSFTFWCVLGVLLVLLIALVLLSIR